MRFSGIFSFLFFCAVFSPVGLAVMVNPGKGFDEFPLLGSEPIAPSGLDGACIARLKYAVMTCKQDPGPSASNACRGQRGEDPTCEANACLRAKNYPRGLDTNPAEHCVRSMPRAVSNAEAVRDPLDAITRPSRQPIETPQTVPVPETRPEETRAERPQRTAAGNWQQEASQDIQQCTSSQNTANRCCGNPSS